MRCGLDMLISKGGLREFNALPAWAKGGLVIAGRRSKPCQARGGFAPAESAGGLTPTALEELEEHHDSHGWSAAGVIGELA